MRSPLEPGLSATDALPESLLQTHIGESFMLSARIAAHRQASSTAICVTSTSNAEFFIGLLGASVIATTGDARETA